MDSKLLNELNKGDKLVEMTEYTLHNEIVYNVSVYICEGVGLLFKRRKIKKYTYPFYFKTKEIANDFLSHWGDFSLVEVTYWNSGEYDCYALILNNDHRERRFFMIDSYKRKRYSGLIGEYAQLEPKGVWNGVVTEAEHGRYGTHDMYMFNYNKIYEIVDLPRKTNSKSYIFKMIKEE